MQKLTDEELLERYRGGEKQAVECLMERYKNLVRMKARDMYLTGGDTDDLIQEGMIGLYKAVRDYDASKGAAFATFAGLCIRRQLLSAVNADHTGKNAPLNDSISFDQTGQEQEDASYADKEALLSDNDLNPENLVIASEHARLLRQSLEQDLSAMEKEVLDLYLEGTEYQQIAQILQRSPKSIDNALQRIRAKAVKRAQQL